MRCQHIDPPTWAILQRPEMKGTSVHRRVWTALSLAVSGRPVWCCAPTAPSSEPSMPAIKPPRGAATHPTIRRNIRGGQRGRSLAIASRERSCSFPLPAAGVQAVEPRRPLLLAASGQTDLGAHPRHCMLRLRTPASVFVPARNIQRRPSASRRPRAHRLQPAAAGRCATHTGRPARLLAYVVCAAQVSAG